MIKIVLYDGKTTYMSANGDVFSPEKIRTEFPAVDIFPHMLVVNGNLCQAVQELSAMRNFYNIDSSLTDDEAVEKIQEIVNMPPPEPEPTAEERQAAAMEFQNLLLIDDEDKVTEPDVLERIAAGIEFLIINQL